MSEPNYTAPYDGIGVVYLSVYFKDFAGMGVLHDGDGYALPMRRGKVDPHLKIRPTEANRLLPEDATHVVWYNRSDPAR